jgi:hypothetical protein
VTETFAVIIGRAEGNERDGFRVAWYWDGRSFGDKALAVKRGFELCGSDDFNIGVIEDGRLVSLWWMDHQIDEDATTLAEIGHECGLVLGA